jgi:uncharacterized protein (DUF983 family)
MISDEEINLLCKNCGAVFSAFLKEMAEKNTKVVCPCCGKSYNCDEAKDLASNPPPAA